MAKRETLGLRGRANIRWLRRSIRAQRLVQTLVPLLALLWLQAPAEAQGPQPEAYCYAVADSGDNLVFINKDGDGFVNMGGTGTSSIEAIAFNPDNARLYAVDGDNFGYLDYNDAFDGDGNDSEFVQISSDVGTCTLPDTTVVSINDVDGLQFDLTRTDASTGTFVLWGTVRFGGDDVLVQIDPTTGLTDTTPTPGFTGGATCVTIAGPSIQTDIDDISVDPITGQLQGVNNSGGATDQLVVIDPVNGSANQVRFFTNTNPPPVNVTDIEGMSFGADGVLYGTTGTSGGGTANSFWRVNKVDGDITLITPFPSLSDYEGVACLLDNVVKGTVFFDTDENGTFNSTIDVGFAGATVRVYIDNNNDGIVDGGDSQLCNNAGGGYNLACPTTDSNGNYIFPVGQGNFVIDVDTGTLPAAHSLTTDNREEADFAVTDFGETDANNDFGFTLPPGSGDLGITKTSNAGGPVVPGQVFQYTIQVTNNGAITHNAIELDDTLPPGVTYVAQSTVVTGPIRDGVLVRDEFETKSYGNNDGPDLWSGNWVENDPDGTVAQDFTEGEVQIFGRRLRLDNQATPQANLPSVQRTVDLSGAATRVYFSFDFILDDGVDSSGDDAFVEISTGGPFTILETINGISGPFFGSRSYDITAFASATTTIRFRLGGDYQGGTFESFAVDNVMIHGGFGDFRDNFENPDVFTHQDGTLNWATDWLEIGENDGGNNGDIQLVNDGGSQRLRIQDNDNGGEGVMREANLTNYSSATLNFDFRRNSLDGATDYVALSVSRDGGSNWVELDRFEGPTNDTVYTGRSYDISNYMASNTRVRFLGSSGLGGGDQVYFDNVDILVSSATVGTKDNVPAGTNADLVNGVPPTLVAPLDRYVLAPTQTMTVTLQVQVDNPIGNITQLLNIATVTSTESLIPSRAQHIDPVSPGATIGDFVWLDSDGDGFQDVGEPGIAGVTLTLYEDPNGVPGSGDEISRGTATTDANGNYIFTGIYPPTAGTYYVDVTSGVPGGLTASPGNSGRSASYTITGAQVFLDADFGYTSATTTAVVGDFVWSDTDNDGIQDPGEIGIGGVTLNLVAPGTDGILGTGDDVTTATTTTLSNGAYRFTGVAPGRYLVDVTDTGSVLTGYTLTTGPQSSTDPTNELTVAASDVDLTHDFGYRNAALFSISDEVWYDSDGDGTRDVGEVGIAGVTVSLLDNGGNLVGTTVSDANGDFSFSSVGNGNYTISITDTAGQLSSFMSTTTAAGAGSLAVVVSGADVAGVNFGYNQPGTIGEIVWSDADGDGVRDAGEPGISGVTMTLVEAGPDNVFGTGDDVTVQTTTTAADGSYLFTGVIPDTYQVQASGAALTGYTQTGDPDATLDGTGTSVLARGASDLTMNFGYRNNALANVSGTVFNDNDQDGFEDSGEPGISGVTLDLLNAGPDGNFGTNDDVVVATTTTDGSGNYSFLDLANGTYRVAVTDSAAVLDSYTLTSSRDRIDVTVAGVDITDVDFGYVRDAGSGSIGDRVWMDGNRDGAQNGSEPGIGNVTLRLYDTGPDGAVGGGDDVLVGTTTTDNNGNYRFANLDAGNYYVDLDQTTLPGGLAATTGTSDPTAVINLSEDENYEDADFGYSNSNASLGNLGDTVFYDADSSGIQEPGEVGIGGVTVRITPPVGPFVDVVTNPDGTWLLTGLAAGAYQVTVLTGTLPAGYNTTPTNGAIPRTYTVVSGQDTLFADFGFNGGTTSTVGDTIYLDSDGDSTQDAGEPGIGGVTLHLVDASNNIVASTVTAADGTYDFEGVPAGDYSVVVTDTAGVLDGLNATQAGGGPFAVPAGTDYNDADFGFAPSGGTGTVGTLVWHDVNGDGDRDAGESGMELVTIELWHDVNNDNVLTPGVDNLIRKTATDLNGEYEIKGVPPGDYLVDVTDDHGVLTGFTKTSGTAGLDNNSQADPYPITLAGSNVTADFGYRATTPQTLSGITYYDTAGNAIMDGLDSGIVNVDVFLYRDLNGDGALDSGDARIGTLASNGTGNYLFTDLPDGNFIVAVDTGRSFLTGASQTTQTGTAGVQPATIAGAPSTNNDFGFTLFATRVVVSSFDAYSDGGQVVVEWETASEVGTVGFYLFRWEVATSDYVQVNAEILPGLMDAPQGGRYRLVDEGAPAEGTLYYGLLEVEVGGRHGYGPYAVQVDDAPHGDRNEMRDNYEKRARRSSSAVRRRSREAAEARRAWRQRNEASRGERRRKARFPATDQRRPQLKMSVSEPGVYFASTGEIANALEVEPSQVARWIGRGQLALESAGIPVAWLGAADRGGLYFYGTSVESIFTSENVYRLRPGKGLTMRSTDGSGAVPVVGGSFDDEIHVEEDAFAATLAARDPREDFWYWSYISAGDPNVGMRSYAFSAPAVTGAGGPAMLTVELYSATETAEGEDHHVAVRVNDVPVGEVRWDDIQRKLVTFELSPSILRDADNVVEVEGILDSGAAYSIFYIDSFQLRYPRAYRALGDELAFTNGDASSVTLSGFSNRDVMVLDVTNPEQPLQMTNLLVDEVDSYRVSFQTTNGTRRYHALAAGAIRSPDRIWTDAPSSLRSRRMSADYLIVSPEELLEAASDLAELRRRGGLEALVVNLEDVHDEFAHGIRTPEALQRFLAFAYRDWRTPPRYVVLLGRGTFDYSNADGENLMPALMTATPNGLYASDVQLADVDGNDGVPEMMLGRIPVLSNEELASYVEKLASHDAGLTSQGTTLMVADNPDPAGHFARDSDSIADLLPEAMSVERIYLTELSGPEAREQLFESLREGASFLNYVGHGGLDRFADEGILMTSDVPVLGNDRLPVIAALTCSVGRFEVPGFVSLGEALVVEPHGGAIAIWSPAGLSFHSEAMRLNGSLVKALADGEPTTLGEAVQRALRDYAEVSHFPFMSQIYNILGDPAARIQ